MTTLNKINISKNAESIIEDYHTPEFISEAVTVRNNVLNLTEVPSEDYSVEIEDFTEVTDFDLLANNTVDDLFYVNYKHGYITLNKEHNFEKITVNYYGIGKSYLSAFRVYVGTDSTGNVAETLGDLFKQGEDIVEALDVYGGYATMILRMDSTTEECNALLNKIDQRIAKIQSTDCQSTMITLTDWKPSSDGIYDYESSISHTLLSTNILCEFENSAGVSINDGSVKYKVVANDKIKVYSNSRLPIKVKYMARYYNGLDSTNVTKLRQELEDSRMDSVNDEIYHSLGIRLNTESAKVKTMAETLNELSSEYDNLQSIIRGTVLFAPDYGVVPNNTSSITPMMQTMANLSKTLGGVTIIIPKGDYYIDKRFELFSNTTLIMCKDCRIFKKDFGDGTHGDFFKAGTSQTISESNGYKTVENISIYGGFLRGSLEIEANGGNGAMGIGLHHCSNVIINGVHFQLCNFYGHCIDLPGDDGVLIENCIFEGFKYKANQDRAYTEVIQIDSSYNGCFSDTEMAFDGLPTKNVTVRNCRFIPFEEDGKYYPAGYPLGTHAFLENNVFENITFENNYVQDCQERLEDHYGGWIRFYAINNLKILNNYFVMTKTVNNPPVITIQNKNGAKDINGNVTNNNVPSRNVLIDGNTFKGFKYPERNRRNSLILCYGLELNSNNKHVYSEGLTVTNNTFSECVPTNYSNGYEIGVDCIRWDWWNDVNITNNTCYGVGRFVYSPNIENTYSGDFNSARVLISDNIINNSIRDTINIFSANNVDIHDNILNECGMGNVVYLRYNSMLSFHHNIINNSYIKDTSFGDETYILKLYNSKFFDVSFNKCYIKNSNFGSTGGVFYIASSCNDGNAMSNITNISAFPGTYVTNSCTNVKVAYNIPSETNNSQ